MGTTGSKPEIQTKSISNMTGPLDPSSEPHRFKCEVSSDMTHFEFSRARTPPRARFRPLGGALRSFRHHRGPGCDLCVRFVSTGGRTWLERGWGLGRGAVADCPREVVDCPREVADRRAPTDSGVTTSFVMRNAAETPASAPLVRPAPPSWGGNPCHPRRPSGVDETRRNMTS